MRNTIKRFAAITGIAGALFVGAQGIATAEAADVDPSGVITQSIDGLGILNGVIVQIPVDVDVHDNNLDVLGQVLGGGE
jgi:hypothetical protein